MVAIKIALWSLLLDRRYKRGLIGALVRHFIIFHDCDLFYFERLRASGLPSHGRGVQRKVGNGSATR
jgi:hypothetical protein